jgi:hypothetical protein
VNPKRKRQPISTSRITLNLLVIAGAALPVVLAVALISLSGGDGDKTDDPPQPEWRDMRETVIVPFDQDAAVRTQYRYRGRVRLFLSGTGQASGSAYSDALYLYTDDAGNPLDEPRLGEFDLEIDGEHTARQLGLADDPPPLVDDHLYAVIYDVGPEPRRISFRTSDHYLADNTGEYRIDVIQLDQDVD